MVQDWVDGVAGWGPVGYVHEERGKSQPCENRIIVRGVQGLMYAAELHDPQDYAAGEVSRTCGALLYPVDIQHDAAVYKLCAY